MRSRGKRHSLGQHYLIDPSVVSSMVALAAIGPGERVLEIGTGRGALTRRLVGAVSSLEGYEVDVGNYKALRDELGSSSLVLHNEDAFESSPRFDVLLSSLPYSESSNFVDWLSVRKYDRAVVLLQTDFAKKLTAEPGSDAYRAVSVISQVSATVELVSPVGRGSFDPPPRVDSSIVKIVWRRTLAEEQVAMVKRIFSQKRRTVRAALKNLGLLEPKSAAPPTVNLALQCRVNTLRPDSVLAMIQVLARSSDKIGGK